MDFKKIRSLIISWAFVPAVVVLAAVAVFTYASYQSVTNDLIKERDRELTYLSAARLRDELSNYSDILVSLSRNADIFAAVDPLRQQQGLANASQRLSVFDGGVVMLNNLGKVVASQPPQPLIMGQDWSNRPYFSVLLATKGPVFSDTLNDGPLASKVIAIVVPVTGASGEMQGALVGMFRLGTPTISAFYASIVRLRIGESGSTYLVDGTGRIIYHSDLALTGENISDEPEVQQVLTGKNGVLTTRDTQGRQVVAAFAPVPGTNWGLVTEEDWAVLTASSRLYGQALLVLLGLGMVLPALGVAQQVRQRNREALVRDRMERELHVAHVIQQTLLPREIPSLPGWEIAAHWQPARAVSGDFYDFILFPDGQLGLVIADVTDKGVPAGLVMASARSILRGVSERLRSPGAVLERTNNLMVGDIPKNMFVTCLYAVIDPNTGIMRYANAGQNLPYRKCDGQLTQLNATGLPLGLMPDMGYDEFETRIEPGELLFFYSDGLVEAHDPHQEMYGNHRLENLLYDRTDEKTTGSEVIDLALRSLRRFTGEEWSQEDDVTLMTLRRLHMVPEEPQLERSMAGE